MVKTGVELTHSLRNTRAHALKDVTIWNCVQLQTAPDLSDPLMERTSAPVAGRFRLLRDVTPGFAPYPLSDAVRERFLAFTAGPVRPYRDGPTVPAHPGHPEDPAQAITFWQVGPPIDAGILATAARGGEWGMATYSRGSTDVWTNPSLSCHHAEPAIARCDPGEVARISSRIVFFHGAPGDPRDLMRE